MKKLNETIQHGFRAVVDLNGLSHRLFQKYHSFIQTQVNFATKEKPTLAPKSRLKRDYQDRQISAVEDEILRGEELANEALEIST